MTNDAARSASSAPARWATASRRPARSPGIDVVMVDVVRGGGRPRRRGDRAAASIGSSRRRRSPPPTATPRSRSVGTTSTTTRSPTCDLVIEAATENLELKLEILRKVDALAKADAMIATNTSSISITQLAAATSRPDAFVGMHFFNPVPMMALVELIRGLQTSTRPSTPPSAFAQAARQDADRREEQPRLRRQPDPVPDAQRGGVRAAGRPRDRRGRSTTA